LGFPGEAGKDIVKVRELKALLDKYDDETEISYDDGYYPGPGEPLKATHLEMDDDSFGHANSGHLLLHKPLNVEIVNGLVNPPRLNSADLALKDLAAVVNDVLAASAAYDKEKQEPKETK
jgi:hypothetical protein